MNYSHSNYWLFLILKTAVTSFFFTSKCVFNSHSSPVHRSQSFHTTNMADLETLDYSSEEEPMPTLPIDPMITSTHSDILDLRPYRETMRRQAVNNDVVMAREYVAGFQVSTLQSNCQVSVGLCVIERKKNVYSLPKRHRYCVRECVVLRSNQK